MQQGLPAVLLEGRTSQGQSGVGRRLARPSLWHIFARPVSDCQKQVLEKCSWVHVTGCECPTVLVVVAGVRVDVPTSGCRDRWHRGNYTFSFYPDAGPPAAGSPSVSGLQENTTQFNSAGEVGTGLKGFMAASLKLLRLFFAAGFWQPHCTFR